MTSASNFPAPTSFQRSILDIGRSALVRRARNAGPICHAVLTSGSKVVWAQVAVDIERSQNWLLMARHLLTAVPCDSSVLVVDRTLFGDEQSSTLVTVGRPRGATGTPTASVSLLSTEEGMAAGEASAELLLSWESPQALAIAAEALSLPSPDALSALFEPLRPSERARAESEMCIDLDCTILLTLEAFERTLRSCWIQPNGNFRKPH